MVDLAAILRDPAQAVLLSPAERQQLVQQCAALIVMLVSAPLSVEHAQDRTLSVAQVAERLNLSGAWVREHAESDLKSARVKLGGAVRFSEAGIDELIRRRSGE